MLRFCNVAWFMAFLFVKPMHKTDRQLTVLDIFGCCKGFRYLTIAAPNLLFRVLCLLDANRVGCGTTNFRRHPARLCHLLFGTQVTRNLRRLGTLQTLYALRRRCLNAMLSQRLGKAFAPPLQVRLARIKASTIEAPRLDYKVHVGMLWFRMISIWDR